MNEPTENELTRWGLFPPDMAQRLTGPEPTDDKRQWFNALVDDGFADLRYVWPPENGPKAVVALPDDDDDD